MRVLPLNKEFQWNGLDMNFAFVLGTTRGTNGASDFTAAATTQAFTLMALDIGDMILYPAGAAYVAKRFTDSTEDAAAVTIANLKLDLGITGALTSVITGANGDLLQARGYPIAPVNVASAAGGALRVTAANTNLVATLTSTAGNINTLTFGEVIIFAKIARVSDNLNRLLGEF